MRLTQEEKARICEEWGVKDARVRHGMVQVPGELGLWQPLAGVEELLPAREE